MGQGWWDGTPGGIGVVGQDARWDRGGGTGRQVGLGWRGRTPGGTGLVGQDGTEKREGGEDGRDVVCWDGKGGVEVRRDDGRSNDGGILDVSDVIDRKENDRAFDVTIPGNEAGCGCLSSNLPQCFTTKMSLKGFTVT